jgi:hypothetical protein
MLPAVTQFPPPPPEPAQPPPTPAFAPTPYAPLPQPSAAERVRLAWQHRHDTDYIFDFWSAIGWTILTLGVYSFYILYQLMRRDRDHIRRRVELLDAATTFAWERAHAQNITAELTPAFERIAPAMAQLRGDATGFRDPLGWLLIAIGATLVGSGGGAVIPWIIALVLMDGDLVRHDRAEGAIEAELSEIYARLGAPIPPPDPGRLKGEQNYLARILVYFVTCGIYGFWWLHDVMADWNRHFEHNWQWEDGLAASVQSLLPAQGV